VETPVCDFCKGRHAITSCTVYLQAHDQHTSKTAEKVAAKKAAAEAKKAAAAASSGHPYALRPAWTPQRTIAHDPIQQAA